MSSTTVKNGMPRLGKGLRLAGVSLVLSLGIGVAGGGAAFAGTSGTRIAGNHHGHVQVHLGPAVSYTRTAAGAVRTH